jgi:peptidoglycan/xylan/chitin deacetylase (PgdA/CDA1 family)
MPRFRLLAACLALVACGGASDPRAPLPAPKIELSASDRAAWAPGPARRSAIPVLVYGHVEPERFARQMTLLHSAGYRTITLPALIAHLRGEPVALPPRPFLLTFDDGRLDSYTGSDATLRRLGFSAVAFVDAGRVDKGDPAYLRWRELDALQRSGRWDVQLEAGTGKHLMRWGPSPRDVGSFYAYRGADEIVGGWRERVFGDLSWGERQLSYRVRGYRPLAIAPAYGNYGQLGTNDPEIPRLLLARLLGSFPLVFVQDRSPLAVRGAGTAAPVGRLQVTSERDLRTLLRP